MTSETDLTGTAIIFDLDDTLYYEADFVMSARREIVRRLSERFTGLNEERMLEVMLKEPIHGPGAFDALYARLPEDVKESTSVMWMRRVYRSHQPAISLRPEVESILGNLRARGALTGIITDGRVETQSLKINALGLTRFISPSLISISESIGKDKYHSEPFQRMASLTAGAARRIYVGDNAEKDFIHPRAMGWITIMVSDPDNPRTIFRRPLSSFPDANKPDYVVKSLEEIPGVIG